MSAADIDPAQRLKDRKPIPKPAPAYLATAGSPLTVDKVLYESAQKAPRVLVEDFTLPIRSGKAWKAPAGSIDEHGGRVHDLLGTRCDPYINSILSGGSYDFQCHSNLTRAVIPHGLNESDVHDVINIFQSTGLDEQGRYFMNPCPAGPGDYIEFLAEQDVLMALSTCPGGDLSLWGFGEDSEEEMIKCCRPLKVEVFKLEDEAMLQRGGWKPAEVSPYKGQHGMGIPLGEVRS
ncbi:hypothetical protein K4K61_001334 [Colletotrichum sp. SAR11_59]|nr:hypothetical protein K4K61_001334 [Colletotrichum sp. SAR11_59]